jgi:hypothetical protein
MGVLQVKVNFFQLFAELWQKGLREKVVGAAK